MNKLPEKLRTIIQNVPLLTAIAFTFLMILFEEKQFRYPFVLFILRNQMAETNSIQIQQLVMFASSIISFILFCWIAFGSNRYWKLFYFILFMGAISSQYSYMKLFNGYMSPHDFVTARDAHTDLWLDSAALFFNPLSLVPIIAFMVALLLNRKENHFSWKQFLLLTTTILFFNIAFKPWGYQKTTALSLPQFFKSATYTDWSTSTRYVRPEIPSLNRPQPTNNIILVIDESARGDHFSINGYERPTTPFLDQLQQSGYLYNWPDTSAAATCTFLSNWVLNTPIYELPDIDYLHEKEPTLFHYAKAAGYTTYYFDAQTDHFWTGLTPSDLPVIDHWFNLNQYEFTYQIDEQMAEAMHDVLQESTGNFILINKRGVHYTYAYNYPAEEAIWTPAHDSPVYTDYPLLKNAYDNAIHYNINLFFNTLFPNPEQDLAHTELIYTSDHGQTLSENGEGWAHCGPTRNEAVVPLFVLSSKEYQTDPNYKASHYNVFPTILDLMDIPAAIRPQPSHLSLFAATASDSVDRFYIDHEDTIFPFDNPE